MSGALRIPELTAELGRMKKGDSNDCLKRSLRAAIKLEFATIPPYLTAMWSIRTSSPVIDTLRDIVEEEMLHMGLACNMLAGLGGSPSLALAQDMPTYPGPLPGDVNPALTVPLRRLTPSQLRVFMDIEFPEGGPVVAMARRAFDTIGAFYAALLEAFEEAAPTLDVSKQRDVIFRPDFHLFSVKDVPDVKRAIDLIRVQGEGSCMNPEESPGHLAHFYQFREVYEGSAFVQDPKTKQWSHSGAPVLMPEVWPMADIPVGGYKQLDVPDASAWAQIVAFDQKYTTMLQQLEKAWQDPNAPLGDFSPDDPVLTMFGLKDIAVGLMQVERPDRHGTYGPCFRHA